MVRDQNEYRTCQTCGRLYVYKRCQGHTLKQCNSCNVNSRRFAKRERLITYKGGACLLCGYNKFQGALEFHHVVPNSKEFNISGFHSRSIEILIHEVDKCVLLCANCHREIHGGIATLPEGAETRRWEPKQ